MLEDIIANRIKVFIDINISVSQNFNIQLFKLRISFGICCLVAWQVMTASVELNDYPCACNIEINDEIADILLPVDGHGQSFEKIIPKMFFFGCHSLAECLCCADELFVVVINHGNLNGSQFSAM